MIPAPAEPFPRRRSSRCWTIRTPDGEVDVEVTAADGQRLGRVLPALGDALGVPDVRLWSGSSALPPDLELTAPQLAHGAVLGLGRPGPRSRAVQRSSALELHVVGGRDAGRTFPLDQGEHVVGRGAEAGVVLTDPDVSRQHLLVRVDAGGVITVADLGSTNGTTLSGAPLDRRPRTWRTGSVARLGGSSLTLGGPSGYPAATLPGPAGRRILTPAPRIAAGRPATQITLPRPPSAPNRRRPAWIAVGLPAVLGAGMAVALHAPQFLFFALLSPAMAVGTWLSDRWSGRRSSRRDELRYRQETQTARDLVAEAVRADMRALESAHPDLATVTTAARRRSSLVWCRRRDDPDALTIRLGTAPGETRVTEVAADGSRSAVRADQLPAVLDLRAHRGLGVLGPRPAALGILRGVLAQLAVLHAPGEVDLLMLLSAESAPDWVWARWLPALPAGAVRLHRPGEHDGDEELRAVLEDLLRRRRSLTGEHPTDISVARPGWTVVVVDRQLPPRAAALLRDAARFGVLTLAPAAAPERLPLPLPALLTVAGETGEKATLRRQGAADVDAVTIDRLPEATAGELARDLAPLRPPAAGSDLPSQVRLLDLALPGLGLQGGGATGGWLPDRSRLVATLGRGAAAPVHVDLCRDGPHALVAGTTGSGKSELLQTLIAGLALNHPPDRCSFLLVDYKGGAAFAEAAGLPHTVGVLTDLDGQTTERALRSLTAELARRERLLAAHQVADLASLPDDVALARLVIVVDEFATLAEELPSFVPGLVGIAQRGRSLGVHLVLATQRPGGVVSPEIRANCTLRICLRTTDEADSRDVLGVPDAAHLPVGQPGRALLRTGSGSPALLQVARVSGSAPSALDADVRVRRWTWPHEPALERPRTGEETDLARICAALARSAARLGIPAPHRPWRPPLPYRLTAGELDGLAEVADPSDARPRERGRLRIGLVDRPAEQAWRFLELDLATGGGWLAVGGPRSGRTTLLRTVLGEAVRDLDPEHLHVHVLDHGGGALAAEAAGLAHTGTTVGGGDPLRTLRLVGRLSEEVGRRRASGASDAAPRLLLLVDGVESLLEQLDEFDPGGGSAAFLRLVREGPAAGLTCVISAERAVPGGRLASAFPDRLLLPLADRSDYLVAGVPAASVPAVRPPGRALVGETSLECQLALPRPLPADPAAPERRRTALRIPPLPERPFLPLPRGGPGPTDAGTRPALLLPIGPGGDEGEVLDVDLARTGGLLVAGPAGSGRSTALGAFASHLTAGGVPVLRLATAGPDPESTDGTTVIDPADDCAFADWLAGLDGQPGVVVADDLGLLGEAPVLSRVPPGRHPRVAVLAAGAAADLARLYQGPVAALRRSRTALLLCPSAGDGDVLGVRLPRAPVPRRAGSGWLITADTVRRVQVAERVRGDSLARRAPVGVPA